MARSVAVSSLISQIRKRADIESATTRHPDADIVDYINGSNCELTETLTNSVQDYYVSTATITTAASTDTYALAGDFYKLRGMFVSIGGYLNEMKRFELQELDKYQYAGGWTTSSPISYHIMGGNVIYKPTPSGVYTITVYYTPAPGVYSGSDSINCEAGWEEFIIWDATTKILARDDRDISFSQMKSREQLQRIVSMAQNRDYSTPSRIIRRRTARAPLPGAR